LQKPQNPHWKKGERPNWPKNLKIETLWEIRESKIRGSERKKNKSRKKEKTHNVALVELALEVGNDVVARGHVGRDENVAPVIRPSRVVVVVV